MTTPFISAAVDNTLSQRTLVSQCVCPIYFGVETILQSV